MISAEKDLGCTLICWIPHWTTNYLDVLILHASTILILIGKFLSKYDSDAVESSLLMVGFRQHNLPLITFLCCSLKSTLIFAPLITFLCRSLKSASIIAITASKSYATRKSLPQVSIFRNSIPCILGQ